VFDYNDVAAVSGEGLANKPFRTMDDPESLKTIHDFWMQEGKTDVKVYAAKFEQIGIVKYDYRSGTALFTDDKEAPEVIKPSYQENPYATPSTPHIDEPSTEIDLRKSIESSVDLEAVLLKVMKDILKDGLGVAQEPTVPTEVPTAPAAQPVYERQTKENVINTFKKVETPEAIQNRLLGENDNRVEYLGQSSEYATYLFKDKRYVVFNENEKTAYRQP